MQSVYMSLTVLISCGIQDHLNLKHCHSLESVSQNQESIIAWPDGYAWAFAIFIFMVFAGAPAALAGLAAAAIQQLPRQLGTASVQGCMTGSCD